jgi:hypothetical protein
VQQTPLMLRNMRRMTLSVRREHIIQIAGVVIGNRFLHRQIEEEINYIREFLQINIVSLLDFTKD